MYFGTIGGLLLPPFSLFLFAGWSKVFKKEYLLVVLPSLIFLGFHCYFPNKQERFILPFIPFFVMLGWIGWKQLVSQYSGKLEKLNLYGMRFFWGLNIVLLVAISPAYSKKSRVETMEVAGMEPSYNGLIVEYTTEYGAPMMPRYYSGKWNSVQSISKNDKIPDRIKEVTYERSDRLNHVAFFEPENLENRIEVFESNCTCNLTLLEEVEPSYLDKFVHWLNPINENEKAFIYQIKYLDK